MRNKKHYILVLAVAVFTGVCSFIQIVHSDLGTGEWIHIRRQAPQNDIESIFSDTEGNIWAGTGGSFHVFDGEKWIMNTYDMNILANQSPFMIDPKGRLYFIDNHELVIWDKGKITRYNNMQVGYPAVGAYSEEGIMYLGSYHITMGGVFLFDGSEVRKIKDGRVRSLAFDESGKLWITHIDPVYGDMKLMVVENGVWNDRTEEIQFLYPVTTGELTVQVAPDGAVWVNNLRKYGFLKNGEWIFKDGGGSPVFLQFDKSGGVWGYGYKKLYKLDSKGEWQLSYQMERGTINNPQYMTTTADSTVWIFDSYKVLRYIDNKWQMVVSSMDLASDIITSIAYTKNGTLVCGHGIRGLSYNDRKHEGISIRKSTSWNNYNKYDDVDLLDVYQLERMPVGDVMAYTDGGFKFYNDREWIKVDSLFVGNETDMLWIDPTMWITTERGLIEYVEGPTFQFYFPFDGDTVIPLKNLTLFNDRVLYMQTVKGDIVSYDGAEWIIVITDNNLTNDFGLTSDGTVWAARQSYLAYWNTIQYKWEPVINLDVGRFIHVDSEDRIWTSGYGNTGYLENGTWYPIPELSGYTSDIIAFSEDGRIAINVFDRDRKEFYGLIEFNTKTGISYHDKKPISFITAVNHPNPFNASTTISFELPNPAKVTIDIFSVTGQHVATIASRNFPSGRNSVVWNAAGDAGELSSSGVYIYRITAGNIYTTGRMLLLR